MNTPFFTGKGDKGVTYASGTAYKKDDVLFDLLGTIDECNSILGIVKASAWSGSLTLTTVASLQELLFIIQAEVASIGLGYETYESVKKKNAPCISQSHLDWIEETVVKLDELVPPIKHFVLPGGTMTAAYLDYARTISRRAERLAVSYASQRLISETILAVLNRLSSILFALARYENACARRPEQRPTYSVS